MNRLALAPALVVALTSACASSNEPAIPMRAPERVVIASDVVGTIADINIERSDHVGVHTFPVAAEQLWNRLPDAYTEVGLPLPGLDPNNRVVGVQNHSVSRRLKNSPLSVFIDCGQDLTGRLADRNRIRLTVHTWLEPQGATSTVVRTRIEASATATERAGSYPCTTTGELEERIARSLALQLTK